MDSCIQLEISQVSQCHGIIFNKVSWCFLIVIYHAESPHPPPATVKSTFQRFQDLTASMVPNISMASSTILASGMRCQVDVATAVGWCGFRVSTAFLRPCPLWEHWSQRHRWLRLAECEPFKWQLFDWCLPGCAETIQSHLKPTSQHNLRTARSTRIGLEHWTKSSKSSQSLKCSVEPKSFPCGLHPRLWTLFQCFLTSRVGSASCICFSQFCAWHAWRKCVAPRTSHLCQNM